MSNRDKKPSLGVIVGLAGAHFIAPIIKRLEDRFWVKKIEKPEDWPDYSDVQFFEWCDRNVATASMIPKTSPMVVRLHSYEAFDPLTLKQVVWSRIDHLIFVADHVRDYVLSHFEIEGPEIHVIPNAIDFDRFPLVERKRKRRKVAWVGGISHKKGPELFVQAVLAIHAVRPDVEVHVAGDIQEPRWQPYFDAQLPAGVVTFHGKIEPEKMPAFFAGLDWILSTSPWESFQSSVAEAIATGCIGLVHDWPGARDIYGAVAHIWTRPQELPSLMAAIPPGSPSLRRRVLEARYSLPDVARRIGDVLEAAAEAGPGNPTVSACILTRGNDHRLESALRSIVGHVDEIVVLVDDRKGIDAAYIARDLGARVILFTPPTYGGSIDFAASRNILALHATKDWILILDSDELFVDAQWIRPMMAEAVDQGLDSLMVRVDAFTDEGQGDSAMSLRLHVRSPEMRWRYPVHNILVGHKTALRSDRMTIRTTYVGDLAVKAARAMPPLKKLWEEAISGEWSSDKEETKDAMLHAAYFIGQTYCCTGAWAESNEWYAACAKIDPKARLMAGMWRRWVDGIMIVEGVHQGIAKALEGLEHHPGHPDLLWRLIAAYAALWDRSLKDPQLDMKFPGTPLVSAQFHERLPEATRLIGLPITRMKEEE